MFVVTEGSLALIQKFCNFFLAQVSHEAHNHSNMEMRLSLNEEDEQLAKDIAYSQDSSKREAVLTVFRRHGKTYVGKKVRGFSEVKRGRKKKGVA
jgi:hypothetical protein